MRAGCGNARPSSFLGAGFLFGSLPAGLVVRGLGHVAEGGEDVGLGVGLQAAEERVLEVGQGHVDVLFQVGEDVGKATTDGGGKALGRMIGHGYLPGTGRSVRAHPHL